MSSEDSESESNTFIGKIYKITCDCGCNQIYVGSTRESALSKRMSKHRASSKKATNTSKLYTHMREMGLENFTIHLLEMKEFEHLDQMRALENEYIRDLDTKNNGLNGINAHTTLEERKEQNRNWAEANPERRRELNRNWQIENKERFKESVKNSEERIKNEKRYYCQTCDYAASRPSYLQLHNQTQKHQRNVEESNEESEESDE